MSRDHLITMVVGELYTASSKAGMFRGKEKKQQLYTLGHLISISWHIETQTPKQLL